MTYETNYLAHYGVKGMKWKVRRDIAQRSRTSARIDRERAKLEKKISKYTKKVNGLKNKKKPNQKKIRNYSVKLDKHKKKSERLKNIQKKLVRGLSEKDIKQGKKQVKIFENLTSGHLINLFGKREYKRTMKKYSK